MVIQRSWKILGDAGSTSASSTEANKSPLGGVNSSSEDSNCSNQTAHSMVTSVASPPNSSTKTEMSSAFTNSFNQYQITNNNNQDHYQSESMKFITTPQMAEIALQKLRQRFSNTTSLTNSTAESAMRSLELVRIAVQSEFDKKVNEMVKHFMELQKMSCALLENAKSQYKILRCKPLISATCNTITTPANMSDNNNIRMALKRPALMKPTSSVIEIQKRFFPESQQNPLHVLPSVGTIKAILSQNQHNSGIDPQQQLQHQPLQQPATASVAIQQLQAQQQYHHHLTPIFWNTAKLSIATRFVLDVHANQAFGYETTGKQRLATKYPHLIRYLPDIEDRDWLISQQIIPQKYRNSRFLFLLYDELCRLYQIQDVYKNKASVDLSTMVTFTVPESMIKKMKMFFVNLNVQTRGIITNSYSISGAIIQPPQQQSNSHLRNALLLGVPHSLPSATITTSNVATTSDSTSLSPTGSSSNITSSEALVQQKSKSSNLSSSHATLTALLNNSSSSSTNTTIINDKCNNSSVNSSSNIPTLLNKLRK